MNIKGSRKGILNRISDSITKISSIMMVLLSFVVFLLTLILINGRPFGVEQLKIISGGVGLLDMELLYTPEQAYTLFATMGKAGRTFDLSYIIPLDLVFPFLYTLFYAVSITWLLHRWLPEHSMWHSLNLIPLFGGIADYLENFGIITMLVLWPEPLPNVALFTMVAGFVKFSFTIISTLLIIGALAGWFISIIKGLSGRSFVL